MDDKERENYIRTAKVILQPIKEALLSLLLRHLKNTNSTLEEFLETWQHDIYHMFNNSTHCCQCPSDYKLPQSCKIAKLQFESVFDISARLPTHIRDNPQTNCCRPIRRDLVHANLDIILIHILLVNFCNNLFWKCTLDEPNLTLGAFLNEYKHKIYHLWKGSCVCCSCEPGYHIPSAEISINENQWRMLYSEPCQPCKHHAGQEGNFQAVCAVGAHAELTPEDLDDQLQNILLTNCCSVRKSIDKIEKIVIDFTRNNKGKISQDEFQRHRDEIGKCLRFIYEYIGISVGEADTIFCDVYDKELMPEEKGVYMIQIKQMDDALISIRSTETSSFFVESAKDRIATSRFQRPPNISRLEDSDIIERSICEVCNKEITIYLCRDCRKSLCETCKRFHDSLVSPAEHKFSRLQQHHLQNIKQTCVHHHKSYDMYCRTHNVPFCDQCSHKGCTIQPLNKCIVGVKESRRFTHVSSLNDNLIQIFESAIRKVKSEIKSIPEKKEIFVKEVDNSVDQIKNVMLDVKSGCLNDIDKHNDKMKIICGELLTCSKEVEQCKTDLSLLVTDDSDLNVFLGLFSIEESLNACRNRLVAHINENKFLAVQPSWMVTPGRMKSSFFNIGIKSMTMPSTINKLIRPSEAIEIDEIKLEKRFEHSVSKKTAKKITIDGCAILSNNDTWLTDSKNKRILIHKIPEKGCNEIKLPYTPFDITLISDIQVAVSAPDEKSIVLYNANTQRQNDKITFESAEGKFGAISYFDDKFIVRLEDFGYYVISIKGDLLDKIPKTGTNVPYVTSSKDKFYFTQWNVSKVFCCDLSGQTDWEFDAKHILDPPNGLSADENGNVYITGTYSNNVVLIASSGDEHREILSQKDNPVKEPRAIAYNATTKRLLIANESGHFVVYAVKKREIYRRQ